MRVSPFVIALAFACLALASPAQAATKRCSPVTGHPGGNATWKIDQIRVTSGFSCKRARSNIRTWVCTLRTTLGGTKPKRTYRLRFRIRNV